MSKWDLPEDPRKKGEKYPNFSITKSPSGHIIHQDDTKGSESITIQHRKGSMVQMHPDGSMVFRSEKHKYEVTFGDNKMMITGVHDVTVNGGASLKVEGDYDMHVGGNMKQSVKGNIDVLCNGNHNVAVRGNQDTSINGSQTTKVKGNSEHTTVGKTYIGADGGAKLESTGGDATVAGNQNVNMKAGSSVNSDAGSDTNINSGGKLNSTATKSFIVGGDVHLAVKDGLKMEIFDGLEATKVYGI